MSRRRPICFSIRHIVTWRSTTGRRFYDVSLIERGAAAALQTIRVVYRDMAQNVDIDADLLILEVTTEVQADGPRTTGMVVSTVDRWPESDAGAVLTRLTQAQLYEGGATVECQWLCHQLHQAGH